MGLGEFWGVVGNLIVDGCGYALRGCLMVFGGESGLVMMAMMAMMG